MRFLICLFSVLILLQTTRAAEMESCGQVSQIQGSSCKELKVTFDLSQCKEKKEPVVAEVKCEGEKATALYRSETSNYRAVLQPKPAAWGKIEFEINGKVWRYVRKVKQAKSTEKVKPVVVEPVIEKPSVATVSVVSKETVSEVKPKIREEDLAALIGLFSGLSFKGSVDTYYAYNSNKPSLIAATPSVAVPQTQNKYHVFDTYHDDLQLSFAHFQIQKNADAFSMLMDVGYGPAMQTISGAKTDAGQLNLKQAVIGYKATDKLLIEAGRFVTYLGYETIESQDNWNYSRGLLFGYFVPFWHQGIKATYTFNDQVSIMGMAANGWNNSYEDNRQKSYGGQLVWTPTAPLTFYLNFISGSDLVPASLDVATPNESKTVYDFISVYKATEKLSFALNLDSYKHSKYSAWGAALYGRYQIDEKWAVAARYEHVDDAQNLALDAGLPNGQKLNSSTLTFEKKLDSHFTLKIEGRIDRSSEEVFTKDGSPTSSQTIGLIGLTGGF